MQILDTYYVIGRGKCCSLKLDCPEPEAGQTVRRESDGATWTIVGVEKWAVPWKARIGQPVGLLLRGDDDFARDDEIKVLDTGAE